MNLHEEKDNEVPLLGVSVYDCLNNRTGLQLEGCTLLADNGLLTTPRWTATTPSATTDEPIAMLCQMHATLVLREQRGGNHPTSW